MLRKTIKFLEEKLNYLNHPFVLFAEDLKNGTENEPGKMVKYLKDKDERPLMIYIPGPNSKLNGQILN